MSRALCICVCVCLCVQKAWMVPETGCPFPEPGYTLTHCRGPRTVIILWEASSMVLQILRAANAQHCQPHQQSIHHLKLWHIPPSTSSTLFAPQNISFHSVKAPTCMHLCNSKLPTTSIVPQYLILMMNSLSASVLNFYSNHWVYFQSKSKVTGAAGEIAFIPAQKTSWGLARFSPCEKLFQLHWRTSSSVIFLGLDSVIPLFEDMLAWQCRTVSNKSPVPVLLSGSRGIVPSLSHPPNTYQTPNRFNLGLFFHH